MVEIIFRMLYQASPWPLDQHMSFGSSFVRFGKARHQLEGWDMGKHTEDVLFALFNGVDEEDLQQGEV